MRNHTGMKFTSAELEKIARSGRVSDIDFLMENLDMGQSFLQCKLIDYALGCVVSEEGRGRIKYFLFNGSRIQRNYAALYFKRLGMLPVIEEAVRHGCIDEIQAYAR